jgi:hypothetical protein
MSNIVDQYRIAQEPYYRAVADEVELFEAAYSVRMPMMLKGPDRLRQDPLRRIHGLQARQAADYRCLQ